MKILVLGGSKAIAKELGKYEGVRVYDERQLSVTELDKLKEEINKEDYDYVINCEELSDIDMIERENEVYENAIKVNKQGVENIIKAIKGKRVKLIQVTTNYAMYGEDNLMTKYGDTKRQAEDVLKEQDNAVLLRVQDVYGDDTNFIRKVIVEMKKHSIIRVVNDQYVAPLSAETVAKGVMEIIRIGCNKKEYSLRGESIYRKSELAEHIKRITKCDVDIDDVKSDAYVSYAKRPKRNILDTSIELQGLEKNGLMDSYILKEYKN